MKEKLIKVREVYKTLAEMGIFVETIEHPEIIKCEQSKYYYDKAGYDIKDYALCKNIVVRDKKGKKFWLVIVDYQSEIDMEQLRLILGSSKLGTATTANLEELLDTVPGSVSLFSIIADKEKKVEVILDSSVLDKGKLAFHPNYSGLTSFISSEDVAKFLEYSKSKYCFMDVPKKISEEMEYTKSKVLVKQFAH